MNRVYFITNRNPIAKRGRVVDYGPTFNPDGTGAIRLGYADIPGSALTDDEALAAVEVYTAPEKFDVGTKTWKRVGSREIFSILRAKMADHDRATVVFLHGFANTFRTALRHAAQIKANYGGVPFNIVAFCWPSDGEMIPYLSYYRDRDDAEASALAIYRSLFTFLDYFRDRDTEPCGQPLHLIAHSMGNYALRGAVERLRADIGPRLPRILDQVLLFAADEDNDAFEQPGVKLAPLTLLAQHVTIYFNRGDRALTVSDATKFNPDRLGATGPRRVAFQDRRVVSVDCTEVARSREGDFDGHDYHRLNAAVIRDAEAVLKGEDPNRLPWRRFVPAEGVFMLEPG
jgi:esterase/lipase superfamily enzyme